MKKYLALVLALVLTLGLLAGCTNGGGQSGTETQNTPAPANDSSGTTGSTGHTQANSDAAQSLATEPEDEEPVEVTYPLTDGATFTCWWPNDLAGSGIVDYNDTPIFQYLEKKTGVHLEFQNPARENVGESYNLMLVSNDYCDMIRQIYLYHTRGFDDAVDSEIILNQLDYMQYTPNLRSRLLEKPEVIIQALTDSGYLAGFPMIMSEACPWVNGMMIRKDWVDKLGLNIDITKPMTMDTLETVLEAFKSIDTVTGPLYMNNHGFTGLERGYNMVSDFGTDGFSSFMQKDGKVYAGILTEDYKAYLTRMVDWYKKGFISPDFVNQSAYISIGNMSGRLNGEFGVSFDCFVYLDGQNTEGQKTDPDYLFAPIPFPLQSEGATVHTLPDHRLVWQGALGISTQCEDVELACRYWDYCYSEEGMLYCNFGELGVTREDDENGVPHLSEWAKHNEELEEGGMNLNQLENYYMLLDGPFYRLGYREYDALSDYELTCGDAWCIGDDAYTMPSNITLSAEEGTKQANIMSDINTYVVENQVLFITGQKSLDEFDAFINQVKSMGIEEVVAIYQAALDRYNARSANLG